MVFPIDVKKDLTHDDQASQSVKVIIEKFKSGSWQSPTITRDVRRALPKSSWPIEDGRLLINEFSDGPKITVGIEFKPGTRETKRGMLTGLGQAISYAKFEHGSFLVSPTHLIKDNDFQIGNYLESVMRKILPDKPVGLITYDPNFDISGENLTLVLDPFIDYSGDTESELDPKYTIRTDVNITSDERYWAWWRDSSPHGLVELLISVIDVKGYTGAKREQIGWYNYWFDKFMEKPARESLDPIKSRIIRLDNEHYIPAEKIKTRLRKEVAAQTKSEIKALEKLQTSIQPNIKENIYQNYKKNHVITINHLEWWDEENNLTDLGRDIIDVYKEFGPGEELKEEFGMHIMAIGQHRQLILDIIEMQKEICPVQSIPELREELQKRFDELGYYKHNPNRSTSKSREFLTEEIQLWNKYNLITNADDVNSKKINGFQFDIVKVDSYVKRFHKKP